MTSNETMTLKVANKIIHSCETFFHNYMILLVDGERIVVLVDDYNYKGDVSIITKMKSYLGLFARIKVHTTTFRHYEQSFVGLKSSILKPHYCKWVERTHIHFASYSLYDHQE